MLRRNRMQEQRDAAMQAGLKAIAIKMKALEDKQKKAEDDVHAVRLCSLRSFLVPLLLFLRSSLLSLFLSLFGDHG